MNNYELYHHGVKGMRWGVRKKEDNAQRLERKRAEKEFKADVKFARKHGLYGDSYYNPDGSLTVTQWYNRKNEKIGEDYATKVLKEVKNQNARARKIKIAATITAGAAWVAAAIGVTVAKEFKR